MCLQEQIHLTQDDTNQELLYTVLTMSSACKENIIDLDLLQITCTST